MKGLHQQVEKIRIFEIVQLRLNIIIKKGVIKRVFAKNEKGYRFTAKNIRWGSLL